MLAWKIKGTHRDVMGSDEMEDLEVNDIQTLISRSKVKRRTRSKYRRTLRFRLWPEGLFIFTPGALLFARRAGSGSGNWTASHRQS